MNSAAGGCQWFGEASGGAVSGGRGYFGSICMPNFAPFFAEHIGSLVERCGGFVPPG